ncbi:accessory Sec system protein Asp1 [Lactobacillus rhamnosus]|uniref:Accessory Sec system protein Asp1 n=1 Tax=Lacticaseibacillus rhamnosus TaxID=47715 RepID=A0A7Y7QJQ8_LACRH|nr:accessory Sec system protein Asp1 [Lacticaseibacillus rhamnosus]NVO89548.1 accessory Sec system protein Asp1 [Lacticaseibacillus rhamnosus]
MLTLMPTIESNEEHPETDPVIELAMLFQENELDFSLLFTKQMPDLRRLLYQVGLERFPWTNIYDEIQNIHVKSGIPYTIHDLVLPDDVVPFFVGLDVFYVRGATRMMQVHFHKDGFVYWTKEKLSSGQTQILHYDDRGFVTTKTMIETDGSQQTFWLDDRGHTVLIQNQEGITVAANHQSRFSAAHYHDMQEIVYEFLMKKSMQIQQSLQVVTNLSPSTLELRSGQPLLKQMIFLVNQRLQLAAADLIKIDAHDIFIFPTSADEELFIRNAKANGGAAKVAHVGKHVMPQYATTLNLGLSNETNLDMIYWRIGDIQDDEGRRLLIQLLEMLQHEDDQGLMIEGTKSQIETISQHLSAFIQSTFGVDLSSEDYQEVAKFVADERSGKPIAGLDKRGKKLRALPDWEALSAADFVVSRVQLQVANRETQKALMHQARIYVDTETIPDLRMMIEAISNGVPLIVRQASTLVRDHQNGIVVQDLTEIPQACRFFLKTLKNWNAALVVNSELIEEFSATRLIKEWQEVTDRG